MKKSLILLALGSVSLIGADQLQYPQSRVHFPAGYSSDEATCPVTRSFRGGGQDMDERGRPAQRRMDRDDRRMVRDDQDDDDDDDQDDNQRDNRRGMRGGFNSPEDRDLHGRVREAISSGWFSKGFEGVVIRVNNGNVMLRGIVDSDENRNKVEDIVKKIEGVKQVNNQIRVRADRDNDSQMRGEMRNRMQDRMEDRMQDFAENPQDKQLNTRIRERLSRSGLLRGRDMVILKTTNGVVVITGNIDRAEDGTRLQNLIQEIEGVRSVKNQLNTQNR